MPMICCIYLVQRPAAECVCLLLDGCHKIVVFDLEYGQPIASTDLPPAKDAFTNFLGGFGHQDVGTGMTEDGIDVIYCTHRVRSTDVRSNSLSYVPH